MQVDALIKELLATGSMNEDTTADLNRWLDEAVAGTLHPDDAAYVQALHARVTGAPAPLDEPDLDVPEHLEGLTIAEWRERALRAEAELAALKDNVATPGN